MDDSLEVLKRQRALIQQHLEWLDAEIAKQEPVSSNESPPADELPKAIREAVLEDSEPNETPSLAEAMIPKAPQVYGDVKLARIGCIAFFVLGIAGFLFFLFGLPYLLD